MDHGDSSAGSEGEVDGEREGPFRVAAEVGAGDDVSRSVRMLTATMPAARVSASSGLRWIRSAASNPCWTPVFPTFSSGAAVDEPLASCGPPR